ncbi:alpha/beta fold hydrolase [Streptomyces sp. NBC_01727]|uniref:alpha/beta fold hydrolase n=1 Tax=Streptomyces sp. NBC_01727 TaxID=2975924 RepID=UPI002E14DFFA|nr:alpha/beta fold hydrolase [Streptomyces sp. NBC_01727]
MTIKQSAWTGMMPVDDTALAVTDTGGTGRPVVYLNGQFASQPSWRRVIAELGSGYRHITYDERARGKSKRSADYSFEAGVRDVGAVLETRGVDRPLLVGWSYGAALGVQWAARNPDRVAGVVSVDGALPYDFTDDSTLEQIRQTFRRMRWLLPLVRPLGMTARMSAEQHADCNVEILEVLAKFGPVLEEVTVPVRFVMGTGVHMGATQEQVQQMRTSLDPLLARNPYLKVSATVASNHTKILRNDFRAVADTVREIAATRGH